MTSTNRLISRGQAAQYCSISITTFSNWVSSGRMPNPVLGTQRWDLKAIDRFLDQLSGLTCGDQGSPLDQWRIERARRSKRNP